MKKSIFLSLLLIVLFISSIIARTVFAANLSVSWTSPASGSACTDASTGTGNWILIDSTYLAFNANVNGGVSNWSVSLNLPSTQIGVSNKDWISVASSLDGTHLIAAVNVGRLYISTNSGSAWTETQPAGNVDKNWIAVASSADGTHLFAAEQGGSIYYSSTSGSSWSVATLVGGGALTGTWISLASSSDGTHLIVAALGGRLYTSSTSGATWAETQPMGNYNENWISVASSSDGTHLIAAVQGGRLYISTNSGSAWTETKPAGAVNENWISVASSSDGTHLIVAAPEDATVGGGVFISINSGTAWTLQNDGGLWSNPNYPNWTMVASDATGSHLIAGIADGALYSSTNSGSTWTAGTLSDGSTNLNWAAAVSAGSNMVAAALGGPLYTSSGGSTWTARTNGGAWTVNGPKVNTTGNVLLKLVSPGAIWNGQPFGSITVCNSAVVTNYSAPITASGTITASGCGNVYQAPVNFYMDVLSPHSPTNDCPTGSVVQDGVCITSTIPTPVQISTASCSGSPKIQDGICITDTIPTPVQISTASCSGSPKIQDGICLTGTESDSIFFPTSCQSGSVMLDGICIKSTVIIPYCTFTGTPSTQQNSSTATVFNLTYANFGANTPNFYGTPVCGDGGAVTGTPSCNGSGCTFSCNNYTTVGSFVPTATIQYGASNNATCSGTVTVTAPATNGLCGSANKTYSSGSSSFGSDTFCATGTATPSTPTFPTSSSPTTNWTCVGSGTGHIDAPCSANLTVAGTCGPAATSYAYNASGFSGNMCGLSSETTNPSSPTFPTSGNSVTWTCNGLNLGGVSGNCTATVAAAMNCGCDINGNKVCDTHETGVSCTTQNQGTACSYLNCSTNTYCGCSLSGQPVCDTHETGHSCTDTTNASDCSDIICNATPQCGCDAFGNTVCSYIETGHSCADTPGTLNALDCSDLSCGTQAYCGCDINGNKVCDTTNNMGSNIPCDPKNANMLSVCSSLTCPTIPNSKCGCQFGNKVCDPLESGSSPSCAVGVTSTCPSCILSVNPIVDTPLISTDYCSSSGAGSMTFAWASSKNNTAYAESRYQFQVATNPNFNPQSQVVTCDTSNQTPPPYNDCPYQTTFNVPLGSNIVPNSINETVGGSGYLAFGGNYYWRVQVYDASGNPSGWYYGTAGGTLATSVPNSPAISTPIHALPHPGFTVLPASAPLINTTDKVVFTDVSQCYNTAGMLLNCSGNTTGSVYLWTFGDKLADPHTGVKGNNSHSYKALSPIGGFPATLQITDDAGSCTFLCSSTSNCPAVINPLKVPNWKEISPFQ